MAGSVIIVIHVFPPSLDTYVYTALCTDIYDNARIFDCDSSLSSISVLEANISFMADLAPYFRLGVDHE